MERAPLFDIGHVECFRPLYCKNIACVIHVLASCPTKFLDNDVLGRGKPSGALNLPRIQEFLTLKLFLHKGVIEKLNFERWVSRSFTHETFSPS